MSITSLVSLLAALGIMLILLDPVWIGLNAGAAGEALAALAAVIITGLIGSVAMVLNYQDWLLHAPSISAGLMIWVISFIGVGCLVAIIAMNYVVFQANHNQKRDRKPLIK